MSRLLVTDSEIRIINAENPEQYHVWPAAEGLEPARKVAEAWEDDELLADLAKLAGNDVVEPEAPAERPRRGRKPKALTAS